MKSVIFPIGKPIKLIVPYKVDHVFREDKFYMLDDGYTQLDNTKPHLTLPIIRLLEEGDLISPYTNIRELLHKVSDHNKNLGSGLFKRTKHKYTEDEWVDCIITGGTDYVYASADSYDNLLLKTDNGEYLYNGWEQHRKRKFLTNIFPPLSCNIQGYSNRWSVDQGGALVYNTMEERKQLHVNRADGIGGFCIYNPVNYPDILDYYLNRRSLPFEIKESLENIIVQYAMGKIAGEIKGGRNIHVIYLNEGDFITLPQIYAIAREKKVSNVSVSTPGALIRFTDINNLNTVYADMFDADDIGVSKDGIETIYYNTLQSIANGIVTQDILKVYNAGIWYIGVTADGLTDLRYLCKVGYTQPKYSIPFKSEEWGTAVLLPFYLAHVDSNLNNGILHTKYTHYRLGLVYNDLAHIYHPPIHKLEEINI